MAQKLNPKNVLGLNYVVTQGWKIDFFPRFQLLNGAEFQKNRPTNVVYLVKGHKLAWTNWNFMKNRRTAWRSLLVSVYLDDKFGLSRIYWLYEKITGIPREMASLEYNSFICLFVFQHKCPLKAMVDSSQGQLLKIIYLRVNKQYWRGNIFILLLYPKYCFISQRILSQGWLALNRYQLSVTSDVEILKTNW